MKTIQLTVICGDDTCYSFEQKKMCRFVRTTHFGTRYHCGVYFDLLEDNDKDCLLRCRQCKEELG